MIVDYFSQLFKASNMEGGLSQHKNLRQMTEANNVRFLNDVSAKEVKAAAFAMHPEKSPGLDGTNPAFFQTFGVWWGQM